MTKIKRACYQIVKFPGFWFCLLAFVILFTIIGRQEFWTGYDTYFHMNTIYEDAMQIKTGHLSYFISMFGFERSGRIVNAMYGPFFNYFCGALLLLCRSWINFEFIIFFITMVIGGYGMYYCARMLKISRINSIILGLLYMTSRPMIVRWLGNFEFTGLGAAVLLPFVIMVGIRIYQRRRICVLPLAIVMAICLQIHLITSLVAVIILVPFVFCGFVMSRQKLRMIGKGAASAILAFCLSGNVFGALYDIYHTNQLIPTFPNFNLQTTSGGKSISLQGHTVTDLGHLYTFLIGLVILLIIIRLIVKRSSLTGLEGCFLVEDFFFLWFASKYFPWDFFLKFSPKLASVIQFPSRFVSVIFLLTLLLVGQLITLPSTKFELNAVVSAGLVILFICALVPALQRTSMLSGAWRSNGVVKYWPHHTRYGGFRYTTSGNRIRTDLRSHDLGKGVNVVHKVTTDYLPTRKVDMYNYYRQPTSRLYVRAFRNQSRYHKFTRDHTLGMTWRSRNIRKIQVPLVKYGNTVVTLNHKRIYPPISEIGTMKIKPRKGRNVMSVRYRSGHVFQLLSLMMIVSWIVMAGMLIKRYK